MARQTYLALDLGAESGRVIAAGFDGERMTLDVRHRFPTGNVRLGDTLVLDFPGIFRELSAGLRAASAAGGEFRSVGVDSWGVDFGFLDDRGRLMANPVHYRDARTDGMPELFFNDFPRHRLYEITGLQVMPFNTLFQLYCLKRENSPYLAHAGKFLMIADLVAYFLSGVVAQEYTLASTSHLLDARAHDWSAEVVRAVGVPEHLLPPITPPGTALGGLLDPVARDVNLGRLPVVASAGHDTAAAVAAVPAEGGDWLFLSSGTWSLIGVELPEPLVTAEAAAANYTNEGGVCGTIRFLKNLMGMWLVQECRREWEREGKAADYGELVRLAEQAQPLRHLINPANDAFLAPGDMPRRIADYCRKTNQSAPESQGAFVRAACESLALAYRAAAENLSRLTGKTFTKLHIVGGGCQNRLLNQFAADATGLAVVAGPVEATALGNALMQGIALGDLKNLADARAIVRRSVSVETFTPSKDRSAWLDAYERFKTLP